MAVCISLMFGRLGTVVGVNTVALMLENHCELVFYMSGITLIGNSYNIDDVHNEKCTWTFSFGFDVGSGVLTFFIPKIHQKPSKPDKLRNESCECA